jgi:hypothetical protein
MNTWELTMIGAGIALEVGLFVCLLLVTRRLGRFDKRLAHLTDAMSLLTETAEAGFRANAAEIGRLGERAPAERDASQTASGRVMRAVRRGRSVQQIAADEQMSEGEVRLRLHLADWPASPPLSTARAT